MYDEVSIFKKVNPTAFFLSEQHGVYVWQMQYGRDYKARTITFTVALLEVSEKKLYFQGNMYCLMF